MKPKKYTWDEFMDIKNEVCNKGQTMLVWWKSDSTVVQMCCGKCEKWRNK